MADLPDTAAGLRHHRQPVAADLSAERRDAGHDRSAGGGVLREGLRDYIPGPTAQPRGRAGAGGCALDALGHGGADGGLRGAGTVANRRYTAARPADPRAYRPATERPTDSGQRPGAYVTWRDHRDGLDARPCVDGLVPFADSRGAAACPGSEFQDPTRPDLGLWPARVNPADAIHRYRVFQADTNDFQGAVPASPGRAARV